VIAVAIEQDLRGETCLAILALLTWAEFHGGRTALIDDTIERFVTVGCPADHGITRALANTKRALARYLAGGCHVPAWMPAKLLETIEATDT
jgi:hypothetical protein